MGPKNIHFPVSPMPSSEAELSYMVYSHHPLFKFTSTPSPLQLQPRTSFSFARSDLNSRSRELLLSDSHLQPEGIFNMANVNRYVANSLSRMVRSVNADGPKYIMGVSELFAGLEGCLTAEELVRREVEELHADQRFVDDALDSKTIEADEEVEVTLRKMARLHEGVAKRVARIMLNDEAIKEIEKKLKKRLSPKKSQSTYSSLTTPGKKRTFDEHIDISDSGDENDSNGSSQDFEDELEAEADDAQAEIIDFELYEKNQTKIKHLIEECKMDISLRSQKIAMNEARIGLIQRELARRGRGGDVVEGYLEGNIELEEPKKSRRARKAEKLPRKRVRTHWQKTQERVELKPVEGRKQFSAEDVALHALDIMEEKLEGVHEREFDAGTHHYPIGI